MVLCCVKSSVLLSREKGSEDVFACACFNGNAKTIVSMGQRVFLKTSLRMFIEW